MNLIIINLVWITAIISLIIIGKTHGDVLRIKIKYKDSKLGIQERNIEMLKLDNKVLKRDKDDILKNAELLKFTLETEIDEIKTKLRGARMDATNKERSKELWKTKFETLEDIVKIQGFGQQILGKYKKVLKYKKEQFNSKTK